MVCFGLLPVRKECEVVSGDVDRTDVVVGAAVWAAVDWYLNTDSVDVVDSDSVEMIRAAVDDVATDDVATDEAEFLVDRDT